MSKLSLAVLLCALALGVAMGVNTPKASEAGDRCKDLSRDAITTLPAPLRKWGKIECTPLGQALMSRKNWIWALIDGSGIVFVPSQMGSNPVAGEDSYFTSIVVRDLTREEFTSAFQLFGDSLHLDEEAAHGYRAEFTSISGTSTTVYFFDFLTFAGGIWCPHDTCVPGSRFVIVETGDSTNARSASI